MAAIKKKLIHFERLADFETRLAAGDILDYSLVCIKDAKLIWTHGTFYGNFEGFLDENVLRTVPQELTDAELEQVRDNLRFIGKSMAGKEFEIDGDTYIAAEGAEIFGNYDENISVGTYAIAEGNQNIAQGNFSHAEGYQTHAVGDTSHTEGYGTKATGNMSHAEGEYTLVSSYASHAEGTYFNMNDGSVRYSTASGYASHAEGAGCYASGQSSHAEGGATNATGKRSHTQGIYTTASGVNSHAEGHSSTASGDGSHAEGQSTTAASAYQHVQGKFNISDSAGTYAHIVGNGTSASKKSNSHTVDWSGNGWFSGDVYVGSTSGTNKDDGSKKLVTENRALLKEQQTLTDDELVQVRSNLRFIGKNLYGNEYVIDGKTMTASDSAEIFGDYDNNIAIGTWSIAEGSQTKAIGRASHAEGALTQALVDGTHTEGYGTKATGYWSHAEGEMTIVSSYASHAEGSYTTMPDGTTRYGTASGYASHVEGGGSLAAGTASHAEGVGTTASGSCSHSEGRYTVAASATQHVEGIANIEDADGTYIHIAGNGTSPTDRSNAYTLDWDGNGWYAGKLSQEGTPTEDKDLATKKYVDEAIAAALAQFLSNS